MDHAPPVLGPTASQCRCPVRGAGGRHGMTPDAPRAKATGLPGILLRIGFLIALVLAANWGSDHLRQALDLERAPGNGQAMHRAIMLGAAAYVGLLALPFVPGAEIGIAMLAAFGAVIAPLVYASTVLAMLLSYALGRLVPIMALARVLSALRLRRAAALVTRAAPLSREARLSMLLEGAPPRVVAMAVRHRYVALALAVNVPGNAIIGGGGGIMMMVGLSGLFAPLPTLLSICIAVAPVPLAVLLMGS